MRESDPINSRPGVIVALVALLVLSGSATLIHTSNPYGSASVPGPSTHVFATTTPPPRAETSLRASTSIPFIWFNVSSILRATPVPRFGAAMGFDPAVNEIVMFGGQGAAGRFLHDTWVYNSTGWTSVTPAGVNSSNTPEGRVGAVMAYYPPLGGMLLYGGKNVTGLLSDTWLWRNGGWTNLTGTITSAPPPRVSACMVYDTIDSEIVLFGGRNPSTILGDTWRFASNTWTNITPSAPNATNSPAHRDLAGCVMDTTDGYVLLFGGVSSQSLRSVALNDTWSFVVGAWHQLNPAVAPSARLGMAMSFDPTQNTVVLFGGTNAAGGSYPDTWRYSAGAWTNITTSSPTAPAPRTSASAASSSGAGAHYILLFGGSLPYGATVGDTWVGGALPVNSLPIVASPTFLDTLQTVNISVTPYGGIPPYSYFWSSLPPGCSTADQAYIVCQPTQASGRVPLEVTISGSQGTGTHVAYGNLTINPLPTVLSFTVNPFPDYIGLGNVTLNVRATGGTGTLNYTYIGLPLGCNTFNSPTISCAPAQLGTFTVTVNVSDRAGGFAISSTTLPVEKPPSSLDTLLSHFRDPIVLGGILIGAILVILIVYWGVRRRRGPPNARRPAPPRPVRRATSVDFAPPPTTEPPASPAPAPAGAPPKTGS
ncbi:MAG TPA: kelch repeat-containing protein [Thermoplasmata archaeon]|nr:kelch repeat-containing protein [Thermoplasmata archaeon]